MGLQFDHIIHFMKEPERGMEELKKQGIHVVNGGFHENRGTYNTLSYFGLKYIELLGIHDQALFNHAGSSDFAYSPFEEIAKNNFREGFAKVNLRTTDLHALKEKLESHGIQTSGPFPLSRRRPDDSLLEWELLYAGGHEGELPLPFFIDWGARDEDRAEALKQDGTIAAHKAGDLKLSQILFVVKDAQKTAALWQRLFELEAEPSYTDHEFSATCYPAKLEDLTFIFASPLDETGAAAQVLTEKGEHPHLITFTGAKEEHEFTMFGGHYRLKR